MSDNPTVSAESVVKFIACHLHRESAFLSPDPPIYMDDPYGLLKLIEDSGVRPDVIDRWMQEAQNA